MTEAEESIRAFLAIEPPENVLEVVSQVQEKMKGEIKGQISWTKTRGQHLTVKFFGNTSQADVSEISAAVKNRAAGFPPLTLAVEKLGVFPDLRRPRVLWAGICGDVDKLMALQKDLEKDFEKIGFPREDRPYRAHLTLARIKAPPAESVISKSLALHRNFATEKFVCHELILFRSRLTPQGAIYTRLAEFPLRG